MSSSPRPIAIYSKLDVLERRLASWRIVLERDADHVLEERGTTDGRRVDALFRGNSDGTGVLFVRSFPTYYAVLHELSHVLDFLKDPKYWLNPASTAELGDRLREQAVFNRMRNSRSWWHVTTAEKNHAMKYVRRLGGSSEIDLSTGKTVNTFRFSVNRTKK